MFSLIKLVVNARDAFASLWIFPAISEPYFFSACWVETLWPEPIIPPFLVLAPKPISSESKTTTETPDFAKVIAALKPVKPAPTITVSVFFGSPLLSL